MRYTLVTVSCPDGCGYEHSQQLVTVRLDELRDGLDSDETVEDAVLTDLLAGHSTCPHCKTTYDVEIGTTVERDGGCSAVTGP